MCNETCVAFGTEHLSEGDIRGKHIIEVGSLDVNGSLRDAVRAFGPQRYVGVDLQTGPGVDEICRVEDLVARFGRDSFDVLISTEMLEHVRDWRAAIHNMKAIVKPRGLLLVTTRSRGAEYHGFPFDYWRYEESDIERIFADCELLQVQRDPLSPGVLMKARKKRSFIEVDCSHHALYSILVNKRLVRDPRFACAAAHTLHALKPLGARLLPVWCKARLKSAARRFAERG
jgi:SAM-dependent methyltransferase